ncbi:MAG: hypothetical protein LBN71_02315 [Tannerella sp.]|nr:hypothetical protein [Tannerella sp.]
MKTSNKKIHFFNPGHEADILSGGIHYTPPASVRKIREDLALLPLWYGDEGDYALVNERDAASRFLSSLPAGIYPGVIPVAPGELNRSILFPPAVATPWGLSPQSLHLFESLQPRAPIVTPRWKEVYAQLTGRQTAAGCLTSLQTLLREPSDLLPPLFCTQADEVFRYISTHSPPYMLKTPYSCSGRGIYLIPGKPPDKQAIRWIEGAIKKQGVLSIEPALDKVCDFAMEFESDGDTHVCFRGLSVFDTLPKGAFSGNRLGTQEVLKTHVTRYIPEQQLTEIQEAVATVLSETLGALYRGYLGVDMLIYRQANGRLSVHPMIEINLRYTMGLVAIQLSSRLVHPAAQGRFIIACDPAPNTACTSHRQMTEAYPLQITGKKITSGYFSLCPVGPETQYRAAILIEN